MLALGEGLLHQLHLHELGGADADGGAIGFGFEVLEQGHAVDGEVGPEEGVAGIEGDGDVELTGGLRGERPAVVDASRRHVHPGGAPEGRGEPDHHAEASQDEHQEEQVDLSRQLREAGRLDPVQAQRSGREIEGVRARWRPQAAVGATALAGRVGPGNVTKGGGHGDAAASGQPQVCLAEPASSHRERFVGQTRPQWPSRS